MGFLIKSRNYWCALKLQCIAIFTFPSDTRSAYTSSYIAYSSCRCLKQWSFFSPSLQFYIAISMLYYHQYQGRLSPLRAIEQVPLLLPFLRFFLFPISFPFPFSTPSPFLPLLPVAKLYRKFRGVLWFPPGSGQSPRAAKRFWCILSQDK